MQNIVIILFTIKASIIYADMSLCFTQCKLLVEMKHHTVTTVARRLAP